MLPQLRQLGSKLKSCCEAATAAEEALGLKLSELLAEAKAEEVRVASEQAAKAREEAEIAEHEAAQIAAREAQEADVRLTVDNADWQS